MDRSIEARIAALEERLGMESGLRASIDRDLAALAQRMTAANHLTQALSITQAEHTHTLAENTQTLAEHTEALAAIVDTLAAHGHTLAEHDAQFASAQIKLDRIVGLLEQLIAADDGH